MWPLALDDGFVFMAGGHERLSRCAGLKAMVEAGFWRLWDAVLGGVDNVFLVDSSSDLLRRNQGGAYTTDGGTNITVSTSQLLGNARDVVLTPCATPKLIVANRDGANLLLFQNAQSVTPTVISAGYLTPVGLHFEDANNLLVTDETLDSVFRVTGDFCSL